MFHAFPPDVPLHPLPRLFTNPFCYTPHPLCVAASHAVQRYLSEQAPLAALLRREGKMFGVLVVRNSAGEVGFLAAFSGLLDGCSQHPYFVPPVYDLQQPGGFFQIEEAAISALNRRISALEASDAYQEAVRRLGAWTAEAEQALAASRAALRSHKEARHARRSQTTDPEELAALERESRFEKAEHKRLAARYLDGQKRLEKDMKPVTDELEEMRAERKRRSAVLQQRLFEAFHFLNARGECRNLEELFRTTVCHEPPAGAGECAAPRLLHYAYAHRYTPLAMAEFWWGAAPVGRIRKQGNYYTACSGKCAPILTHMLQGLDVEPEPTIGTAAPVELDIVYEDAWLAVVNKPAGLLAVPGKDERPSVYSLFCDYCPTADGPVIVHRIDMDTSGLMVLAKTKEAHRLLQQQFEERTTYKRYTALLEARPPQAEGTICLPLCPDVLDRPRQMVDYRNGKPAETHYKIIGRAGDCWRVSLIPFTGRTHQLRVHAAHPAGLGAPIVGDPLYGQKAGRLYLHAEELHFTHPVTQQRLRFSRKSDF